MDGRSTDTARDRRGGRGAVTALLAAVAVAAVPAGVALAGGSDGSPAGHGNGADCPEKDGQGGEESTEI